MHKIARGCAFEHLALGIDDLRLDAEERPRRGAGLEPDRAGQRRDQNAAGLGLPPGVDDRDSGSRRRRGDTTPRPPD